MKKNIKSEPKLTKPSFEVHGSLKNSNGVCFIAIYMDKTVHYTPYFRNFEDNSLKGTKKYLKWLKYKNLLLFMTFFDSVGSLETIERDIYDCLVKYEKTKGKK